MLSQRPDIHTHYATLGLKSNATQEEIKQAYAKKSQELTSAYTAALLYSQSQQSSSQAVVMQTMQVQQPASTSKQLQSNPQLTIDGLDKFLDGIVKEPFYNVYDKPFHTNFSLLDALGKIFDRMEKDGQFRAKFLDRYIKHFHDHYKTATEQDILCGKDTSSHKSKFKEVDGKFNKIRHHLSGEGGQLFEELLVRIQLYCPDVSENNTTQIRRASDDDSSFYHRSYRF